MGNMIKPQTKEKERKFTNGSLLTGNPFLLTFLL